MYLVKQNVGNPVGENVESTVQEEIVGHIVRGNAWETVWEIVGHIVRERIGHTVEVNV